jgi:hypothetical protein
MHLSIRIKAKLPCPSLLSVCWQQIAIHESGGLIDKAFAEAFFSLVSRRQADATCP